MTTKQKTTKGAVKSAPAKLTLVEAQDKRRNEVSGTQLAGLYVAICDLLKQKPGTLMTTNEIGTAFGVPRSDARHAMQRQGKLSSEGQPVVEHPTDPKVWIHLIKLTGNGRNRNGYIATKAGNLPPVK